jgi:hypothetical protein
MYAYAKLLFGVLNGTLAMLFCMSGGIYLLLKSDDGKDTIAIGLGLYFVGKGLFVGPMLVLSSLPNRPQGLPKPANNSVSSHERR